MGASIIGLCLRGDADESERVRKTLIEGGAREVFEHLWVSKSEGSNGALFQGVCKVLDTAAGSEVFVSDLERLWSYSNNCKDVNPARHEPPGIKWLIDNHEDLFPQKKKMGIF